MQRPETILLSESGSNPFPFVKNAWNLFSKKGKKTVFISIGSSDSAIADLEIAETIGCPLIVVPGSEAGLTGWIEVTECIKTHEPVANAKSDFSKGADEKWILPKNLRIETTSMPWWNSGSIQISENYAINTVPFFSWVEERCKIIGLSSEETRIDILKIDIHDGMERSVLYAALDAGFRPSLLLVNWDKTPDTYIPSLTTAGHIQNSGYVLLRKEGAKFLYYFVDSDMYTICSWENINVVNPMVDELVNETRKALQSTVLMEEGTAPLITESLNR